MLSFFVQGNNKILDQQDNYRTSEIPAEIHRQAEDLLRLSRMSRGLGPLGSPSFALMLPLGPPHLLTPSPPNPHLHPPLLLRVLSLEETVLPSPVINLSLSLINYFNLFREIIYVISIGLKGFKVSHIVNCILD